jgi:MFS family permease
VSIAAAVGFVAVERRVRAPLVDLALLRNRVLVGATLVILIVAGSINGLMYVVSLYFQDPQGLGMTPLEAGLATLPAAAGLVVVAPFVSRLAARIGGRPVIALGFIITTAGFFVLTLVTGSWGYAAFVLPLIAVAVGMGFSNGCASSAATACVPESQVGAASGISNMARYVGASLLTAAAATIYGSAAAAGDPPTTDSLVTGVSRSAWLMTIASALGIGMAALARYRARHPRTVDHAAVAAGVAHTVPVPPGREPVGTAA